MSDKFNRDTASRDERRGSDDGIIKRFLSERASVPEAHHFAQTKYPGDSKKVNEIMDTYTEVFNKIYKKARKFKQVLFDRYQGLNLSLPELMKKAQKYQKRYKFSDDEYAMFVHLAMADDSGKYNQSVPTTRMAKTLGYDAYLSQSKLSVAADEASIVDEIVGLHGSTKPLHAQVLLQTLTYKDTAPEAITGKFDERRNNQFAFIHPVIAALFIPKFKLLEDQMLLTNIGYIVERKVKGQPIQTLPDYMLYWNMITDPNDVACTPSNAVVDLKNRYILQTHLWDAVLNLRQGKYYYPDTSALVRFMQALEQCKNVIHDAPDLTYVRDEGTILRRLLSAFSLYPTYVSVNRLFGPLAGGLAGNPYGAPTSPMEVTGFGSITRVPMITLRLPFTMNKGASAISLEDALTQPQWFVENKAIVPKSLQIIFSQDVLIFYVNRRFKTVNMARFGVPCTFNNLPMTIGGAENLNEYPVNAPSRINLLQDSYVLRSVVTVEKTNVAGTGKSIIVGSTAMILQPVDVAANRFQELCYLYDPQGAGTLLPYGDKYERNSPITCIPENPVFMGNDKELESFSARARCRGSIFIYQKEVDAMPC